MLASGMSRQKCDISTAVERVAAGDLSARIAPAGAQEFRRLGVSFNTMTARLEAAQNALREAAREAAWREVARRLAHEFKNILTPMALSLHRLEGRADAGPEAAREPVGHGLEAAEAGGAQTAALVR